MRKTPSFNIGFVNIVKASVYKVGKQQKLEFIDEHPIIRSMSDYEAIAKLGMTQVDKLLDTKLRFAIIAEYFEDKRWNGVLLPCPHRN